MRDKEVENLIKLERKRQKSVVNLIASENYVSKDVMEALGSELTNKYAEGYSGMRYYGGNALVDKIESLAKSRALKLFGLSPRKWHVNVQPLSGSPANLAAYIALVPLGEKIMGMELGAGGHLTHGHRASATGKMWKQVPYGVDKATERIDYEELAKIAMLERPKLIVAGFTAYPRKIDWKKLRDIADGCGAFLMADMSHVAGLVAGKAYPSPFPFADVVTTTTHKTLRGPRSALIYSRADDRELDKRIDKAVFPGLQGGPHVNQIAATAVALREAMEPEFKSYAKRTVSNAKALAETLKGLGWRLVSGGTDSHLVLVDTWMSGEGIGGAEASDILEKGHIIVNKNAIPFDGRAPADPSGIRLGTAAETTRGASEKDMIKIARRIDELLRKAIDEHHGKN